ncbi:hypothetical protein [Kitasatospora sp. NPDC050543]|uniref:hypothetical protein n=1 Tax=Kitasatospora sp. NPDC050543 TaxID=3364054 RepID=UPI0037898CBE
MDDIPQGGAGGVPPHHSVEHQTEDQTEDRTEHRAGDRDDRPGPRRPTDGGPEPHHERPDSTPGRSEQLTREVPD